MTIQKPYSEETGKMIDEEVRKLVSNAYERTKTVLLEHKDKLSKVAELLLQKEMIFKEDLESILGKRAEQIDLNPSLAQPQTTTTAAAYIDVTP
jgi:cell division protease FtsH